jgi:uncharacterized protein DUF6152
MTKLLASLTALAALGLACFPAQAHHSFAAEYDTKKPVELTGTVTSIEWVNPHAWIHLDVKDEGGKVTSWNFELGSPNLLLRNGWRKDTIKAGDVITVSGSAAKDGSNLANAKTVKTVDGKRVFNAGSSGEPGTPGAPSGGPQQ